MIRISKYILVIAMIMLIACVGSATAAVPHACAQCSPETTYPGSDICPRACIIVFPADTEWAYPSEEVADEEEEAETEELDYLTSTLSGKTLTIPTIDPEDLGYLTSTLSGETLTVPTFDPEISKLSGDILSLASIDPLISKLSGTDLSSQVPSSD